MTIIPGELLLVTGAAQPEAVLDTNFSILNRTIYQFLPSYQNGAANDIVGPPTAGVHWVDELWRDVIGAAWVCTADGEPGTWTQIAPAVVDANPDTTLAGYWIIRRDLGWKHYHYDGGWKELFVPISGGTLTGFLSAHADPASAMHIATKGYVDAVAAGARVLKAPVRVVEVPLGVNLAAPGASIDGVALVSGDRVLLTGQSDPSENGIWIWNGAAVAMTRADDFNEDAEAIAGALVAVTEGAGYADTMWLLTTNDPIDLGTTNLTFGLLSFGGEANTASNVGGGDELFKGKSGVDLQFRTLVAGAGITINQNTNTVEIVNAGGDVVGPAGATNNNFAAMDGTTGKLIKDSGKAVPAGAVVGTSDTQDLTNKNIITSINAQTGTSYTPVLGDGSKLITLTNASAIAFTVPPNSSVAYAVGTVMTLLQGGAGQVTVGPGSGVTVSSRGTATKTAGIYAMAVLTKIATDTWILAGDITT